MLGYGGAGHDGAYLADSIMVISVEGPNRVAITSLPRDTYTSVQAFVNAGKYSGKINVAYELPLIHGALGTVLPEYDTGFDGAGKLASKAIGDYLGIPIDYYIAVDFTAFRTVVDAIGGIDVVNAYVLDDYQYPTEAGGYTHVHFEPGPLHLNGDQALIYVRERHADNDFGRSRRQQQVLAAIKDKAVTAGSIPQLFTLLDAIKNNVHTDLSPNDLTVFSSIAGQVDSATTHHVSIDSTTLQYSITDPYAGYILLPRDRTGAYLRHFIQSELVDPAVLGENATIQFSSTPLQTSQGQPQAAIWSTLIGMLNFKTAPAATSSTAPPITEIHDYSGGTAAGTVAWLAGYFNGVVDKEAPVPGGPQVVVALGSAFAASFDTATYRANP
jgi:LCP family protein required for cell wall assembly